MTYCENLAAFSFETAVADGHLRIAAHGPFEVDGFRRLIDAAALTCATAGFTRLLLDTTGVDRPRSEMDRFTVGAYAAEKLAHRVRVAILWQPQHINRFGENAAVNRGAIHRTFADADEALAWLGDD